MENQRQLMKNRLQGLGKLVLIIAIAFLINSIILLILDQDPISIYSILFKGAFLGKWNIARTLRWATPLILTGLAASVGFRGGMFNLGIDGQLYFGAFAATWVGFTFTFLPKFPLILIAIVAASIAGGIWAAIAGWINIKFGASEVVVTLMMNYIAQFFTEYLVLYPFYTPGIAGVSKASENIAQQAKLSQLIQGSQLTTALIISLIIVLIIYFWNNKTVSGYELKVTGQNQRFANFSGINVWKRQMQVMAISGGIAGIAGALEILGIHGRFVANFSSGLGFDGIVASLLASNNPLLIPFSALFMGSMTSGSTQLEVLGGIPRSMVEILVGIIITMVTIRTLFKKKDSNKVKSK